MKRLANGTPITPSHVTLIQVARLVGVKRQSVVDRIMAGDMPALDYGGEPMVSTIDVRSWIIQREAKARKILNGAGR